MVTIFITQGIRKLACLELASSVIGSINDARSSRTIAQSAAVRIEYSYF